MTISEPTRNQNDPDRFLDCQQAVEGRIQALIDEAVAVGWSKAEVLASIQELTDNLALADGQNLALSVKLRKFNLG